MKYSETERVHTERTFEFVAEGPMSTVAPLFGAGKERLWAPGWNPRFVWPASAQDCAGMVFTVAAGHGTAVWINTRFDLENGRFQYANVVPGSVSTLISVELKADGQRTHVVVAYSRTALAPGSDSLVESMAARDGRAGPEWAAQINAYLQQLDA